MKCTMKRKKLEAGEKVLWNSGSCRSSPYHNGLVLLRWNKSRSGVRETSNIQYNTVITSPLKLLQCHKLLNCSCICNSQKLGSSPPILDAWLQIQVRCYLLSERTISLRNNPSMKYHVSTPNADLR